MTSVELTNENERFVDEELAEGTYRSRDELLNDALAQFRTYRELIRRIEEGNQQLEDGRYLDVDKDGLKAFFENLKAQNRERFDAQRQSP